MTKFFSLLFIFTFFFCNCAYAQYNAGRPPSAYINSCAPGTVCTTVSNQQAYCEKECRKKFGQYTGDVSVLRAYVDGMRQSCTNPQTGVTGDVCTPINNSCQCLIAVPSTGSINSGVRG